MSKAILSKKVKKSEKTFVEKETTLIGGKCLVCGKSCKEERKDAEAWKTFEKIALNWSGIEPYGDIYEKVDWKKGPKGNFIHKLCRLKLVTAKIVKSSKKRLEDDVVPSTSGEDPLEPPVRRRRSDNQGIPVHSPEICIFCGKAGDNRHTNRKYSQFFRIEQLKAWNQFKSCTPYIKDTNTRERILTFIRECNDPFAKDIRYHKKCWQDNVRETYQDTYSTHFQNISREEVKIMFFQRVNKCIFENNEPRLLSGLLEDFNNILENYNLEKVNQARSVKEILEKEFGDQIGFHKRYNVTESTIVYNRSGGGDFIEAAIHSWGIDPEQLLHNSAKRLREMLIKSEPPFQWPPHKTDVDRVVKPPNILLKFTEWLSKSEKKRNETEEQFDADTMMLADLMWSKITGKRTCLKSLLGITVHGTTRSKELITLLNKLGLSISYSDVQDAYAAWTLFETTNNPICPEDIKEGIPGIAIIDNDDFAEDTLTGGGTTHTTNMVLLQNDTYPTTFERNDDVMKIPNYALRKNLHVERTLINPYKTNKRGNPSPLDVEIDLVDDNTQRNIMFAHATFRHISAESNEIQPIGAYSGFQYTLHPKPPKAKAYYHLTFPSPPDKSTVHQAMITCNKIADHKNMPFIQLVGDQPVFTLITELKHENREKFDRIIPILGSFHIEMAFMSTIYKRFSGCGLSDLVVAAGLVEHGSVDKALRGGHYKRCMRIHKLVYECLARRMIKEHFTNEGDISLLRSMTDDFMVENTPDKKRKIVDDMCETNEFKNMLNHTFGRIKNSDSEYGKFWITYMEMVEILFLNYTSLREQNWDNYLISLKLMLPWMSSYNNIHYSRYLPVYWSSMKNLLDSQRQWMMNGNFSFSLTGKPFTCIPPDQVIEMTMNKDSKIKGGWIGITKNLSKVNSYCLTINTVMKAKETLQQLAVSCRKSENHPENNRYRRIKDEKVIDDLNLAIDEWDCDPWSLGKAYLRSMQSGLLAPSDLVKDFQDAYNEGVGKVKLFFEERIRNSSRLITDTISKNKRFSFSKLPSSSQKGSFMNQKTMEMENKAMALIVNIAQEARINLDYLMNFRLTDMPLALFNASGSMRKVVKSKTIESFSLIEAPMDHADYFHAVIDMGYIWRLGTPTKEDRQKSDRTQYTWKDYALKLFNILIDRHPLAKEFYLVNDRYDVSNSIKDSEHLRRAEGVKFSKNVYPKDNSPFPPANQVWAFFTNVSNKMRLQNYLQQVFMNECKRRKIKMYYSMGRECIDLSIGRNILSLICDHIEADTKIFYYISVLNSQESTTGCIIDAEDTDVYVIASKASHEISGKMIIYRKGKYYDCKQLCPEDIVPYITQVYVISGCDSVSGFYGHGKKTILKRSIASPEVCSNLSHLGKTIPFDTSMFHDAEEFVLKCVYNEGGIKYSNLNRVKMWNKMKKKNTGRLNPDKDSLLEHVKRANYQIFLFDNYHDPSPPPSPIGNGWLLDENGYTIPEISSVPPMPNNMQNVDVQGENDCSDRESESSDDEQYSGSEDDIFDEDIFDDDIFVI